MQTRHKTGGRNGSKIVRKGLTRQAGIPKGNQDRRRRGLKEREMLECHGRGSKKRRNGSCLEMPSSVQSAAVPRPPPLPCFSVPAFYINSVFFPPRFFFSSSSIKSKTTDSNHRWMRYFFTNYHCSGDSDVCVEIIIPLLKPSSRGLLVPMAP